MQNSLTKYILNLLILLTIGFGKTYGQISLTANEVRKINETYAKLDSAQAQGRITLLTLKSYQDSTTLYKDSSFYWRNKALKLKRRRNNWRNIAIIEALYIGLTFRKK